MLDLTAAVQAPQPSDAPQPEANAPATPQATPEQPARLTPSQRRAAALSKLRGEPAAPAAAPVTLDSAPARGEPAQEAEPADEQGAEAREGEDKSREPGEIEAADKLKQRLIRATTDLRKRDQALRERDQSLQSVQQERDQIKKDLETIREALKDPFQALKLAGTSFPELTRKFLNKEVKPPDERDELKTQVDEKTSALEQKLAELEAWKKQAEEEKAQREAEAQQREMQAKHLEVVQSIVEASKDQYPLIAAIPNGAKRLLDQCYALENNDPTQVAPAFEKAIRDDLAPMLSSPKVVAALLKGQPKLRESLLSALGVQNQEPSRKTPPAEGPRALASDVVSAPTNPQARPARRSEREKRDSAIAKLVQSLNGR